MYYMYIVLILCIVLFIIYLKIKKQHIKLKVKTIKKVKLNMNKEQIKIPKSLGKKYNLYKLIVIFFLEIVEFRKLCIYTFLIFRNGHILFCADFVRICFFGDFTISKAMYLHNFVFPSVAMCHFAPNLY